jgi:hypothetical protein
MVEVVAVPVVLVLEMTDNRLDGGAAPHADWKESSFTSLFGYFDRPP